MAIYRNKRTRDFCVLPNALVQDKALTYKARGLLSYLLSKPENWEVRKQDMITDLDGDSSIRSALQELKDARYIRWVPVRDDQGKVLRWEYNVYDEPRPLVDFPLVENQHVEPDVDFPLVGFPLVGFPLVENHPPYKEQILIKTEKKTKQKNTVLSHSVNETLPPASSVQKTQSDLSPETLVTLYNAMLPEGLPRVVTLSDARRKKARLYLRQFPSADFWTIVMERLGKSSLLLGLKPSPGHEHFRADFDWLLTKGKDGTENCVKVFEGKFEDTRPKSPTPCTHKGAVPVEVGWYSCTTCGRIPETAFNAARGLV